MVRALAPSVILALVCWTGLGGKGCEDWGWDFSLSFIWSLEVQIWGNVKRMDFHVFFKHVYFTREEKIGEVLLSASLQDVWITADTAVLAVLSSRDAGAGCNGISISTAGLAGSAGSGPE